VGYRVEPGCGGRLPPDSDGISSVLGLIKRAPPRSVNWPAPEAIGLFALDSDPLPVCHPAHRVIHSRCSNALDWPPVTPPGLPAADSDW
jgi:hypothetical protein